jgi:hypothetical protein
MANRLMRQFHYGLENKVVDLYAKVAVGAAGAPTLNAPYSKGIKSVTRASAGKYTITLQDPYVSLMMCSDMVVFAAGSPVAASMVVRSFDTTVAKTVVVEFLDATFTAADLPSGSTVLLKFELKDSGV